MSRECAGDECKFDHDRTAPHLLKHILGGIPTKIRHDEIDIMPVRSDFIEPKLRASFSAQVNRGGPILFLPNDIVERMDYINGIPSYRIYLFGILPCGSKTIVILEGIELVLDVMVPTGDTAVAFTNFLRGALVGKNIRFTDMREVQMRKLKGFQKAPRVWKRIVFSTLQDRRKAIDMIKALNVDLALAGKPELETASDDTGFSDFYFPKVARESNFATADWNRLTTYTVEPAHNYSPNCDYVFRVKINDFVKLDKARRAELRKPTHPISNLIDRDNSILMVWDIETWRSVQNGLVPTTEDNDYVIFMLCSAYFWHYSSEPLMTVCVQHTEGVARKGISVTIECDTERQCIVSHMKVAGKMAPEFMLAFNGAKFDWPLYKEKCRREGLLLDLRKCFSGLNVGSRETEESVLKWSFKQEKIKIDAETTHTAECVAKFPGIIDGDVMPIFLKMYPKMEVRKNFSLNFFLAKNGLESKEDMHFKRMFKIYERALKLRARKAKFRVCHCETTDQCSCCTEIIPEIDCVKNPKYDPKGSEPEYFRDLHADLIANSKPICCECGKRPRNLADMQDVAYYCTIDCIRPQQLCNKRVIIPDKRELSTMSFVSLYDSFYRADGMKVRNLIGRFSVKYGIAFSNAKSTKSPDDKDHYPGAWVFPPTRGLNARRPITGLDFASLYPSLMMAYNLSPDMVVYTREEADRLAAEGYSIHHIKPFPYERGAEKGSAMNKHLTAEGWTVRHNGVLNPKRDKKTVARYVKTVTYTDSIGATVVTESEPTPEQAAEIAKMTAPSRRVKYVGVEGRDPLPGERMGLFAFIVKKLFDRRVPIKAEFVRLSKLLEQMEVAKVKTWTQKAADGTETTITMSEVKFQIAKVDSKQRAVKVLANTFYGESGNYRSSVYELLVAAGITGAGQDNIKAVATEITGMGFGPQYGDSVTADTPIIVRDPNGDVMYLTIDNLSFQGLPLTWTQYGDTKEQAQTDLYAWSENGWTEINRVIRHRTNKDIYRIITNTGCVDVTSDHSLLDPAGNRITPLEVQPGTPLLHADLPEGLKSVTPIQVHTKLDRAIAYYNLDTTGGIDDRIVSLKNLGPTADYVYDLETANHHFSAGIGRMIVHNTDSIYTTCPESVYAVADADYELALAGVFSKHAGVRNTPIPETPEEIAFKADRVAVRTAYWTAQVDITMKVMFALKEKVSDFLLARNGTLFLNMAYEEVGFPTVLCGKKKYYMTPHIETINFKPKDIFIRGIDIIKQGQTQISKKLGDEFMRESLSPENERALIDIAEDKIKKFFATKLTPEQAAGMFSLSAKYNSSKKNVPVQVFVSRMIAMQTRYKDTDPALYALYEPPESGDKFMYVIVKKEVGFTLHGSRIEVKKGDQMEFLRVYLESHRPGSKILPMELDLNYYVKNAIVGIFARFIAYHPKFQPPAGQYDVNDKDQYKQLDQFCIKAASKYLEQLCDSITGFDKQALNVMGRAYRKEYREVDKAVRNNLNARYGTVASILTDYDLTDPGEVSRVKLLVDKIIAKATDAARECVDLKHGEKFLAAAEEAIGVRVYGMRRLYKMPDKPGMTKMESDIYKAQISAVITELYQIAGATTNIIWEYSQRFAGLIDEIRARGEGAELEVGVERVNNLSAAELETITRISALTYRLTSLYKLQIQQHGIWDAITRGQAKEAGIPLDPKIDPAEIAREEAKATAAISPHTWG